MPISAVLQRFVNDELTRAPALVERVLAGTLLVLRDTKSSPLGSAEKGQQLAMIGALSAQGDVYQRAFLASLQTGVHDALEEQQEGISSTTRASGGGLQLMDESRVEIDIEISRAMQLIDTTTEWELRELQTFTSTLVGQTHVSAESNPFRPAVYASALWDAGCAVSEVPLHRTTILRVSAGVAAGLLKAAWAGACARLEAQGVEPSIYRTVLLSPGTTTKRQAASVGIRSEAMVSLLASMPSGATGLQSAFDSSQPLPVKSPASTAQSTSAEFEQAMARLDELLRHLPQPAERARDSTATLVKRLNLHRAALMASAATPARRQIIELLSRVFDTILSDPQVPTTFISVLSRLQASALRVALTDAHMLSSTQHPVWRLLDRIAEAGTTYPHASDARAVQLLGFCHDLAEQLAKAASPDATLYERAQTQLEKFLADELLQQLRAAEPAVRTLQLAERREVLEQRLVQRLIEQSAMVRTSATMRRFVVSTWAKVLAESMLIHGDQAALTRGYIKLVDELLWSLQLPDHPQSRQRLVSLLPDMLKRLRSGMELIRLPAAEQEGVLDELIAIHTEALRPGRGDPATLTPEQLVQRMRDELVPASSGHGGFADSVIDVASMETVPAELMRMGPSVEEPAKRVNGLRAGDRLRLFVKGRWSRVQLIWRSELALYFLFASETPASTHSITQRALERLNQAGLMLPLENQTLIQRAIDSVAREVVRPA
jgi:hypothetical protein